MNRRLTLMFTVFLGVLCSAQDSKRAEVFAGYSHIVEDFTFTNENAGLTGWNVSVTAPLSRGLGVVADFAGYYPGHNVGCVGCGQSAKVHTFLFGPQYSFARGHWTAFGRFSLWRHESADAF